MTTLSATVKSIEKPGDEYQVRVEFEKPLAFLVVTKEEAQALVDRIGTMIEVKVDIGLPATDVRKFIAYYPDLGTYLTIGGKSSEFSRAMRFDTLRDAQSYISVRSPGQVYKILEVVERSGVWVLV